MSKRTTKRDVILEGIDKEIASVKADIATAEAEMAVYRSNLSSLYAVEHALEKLRKQTAESLAPQPRQATTKTATKIASKKSSKKKHAGLSNTQPPLCTHVFSSTGNTCNEEESNPIHNDAAYGRFHPFESGVGSAGEGLSTNGGEGSGRANIEAETGVV